MSRPDPGSESHGSDSNLVDNRKHLDSQGSLAPSLLGGREALADIKALNGLDRDSKSPSAQLPECNIADWLTEEKFAGIDTDGNGFLNKEEIQTAHNSGNYSESEKKSLRYMQRGIKIIEEASNDEWLDENDGITFNNVKAYKPYTPDLKFSPVNDMFAKDDMVVWASTMADSLRFPDDDNNNYTNAFRHTLTTAMYALKYGDRTAMALADTNEFVTGLRDTGEEWLVDAKNSARRIFGVDEENVEQKDTYWRYDTRADDYNNQVGLDLARELRAEAERTGEPVSIDRLLNRVVETLEKGDVVTDVYRGKNQYGKLLQDPGVSDDSRSKTL